MFGLLAGRHISNITQPKSAEKIAQLEEERALKEQERKEKRLEKELTKQKDKADYIAAPSSYGPFIKTQKIDVVYGDDNATALIEKDQAQNIKIKQDVILYDTENNVMPLGGIVHHINNEDGKRKITIQLPKGTNTKFLANKVGVITKETIVSQRIPLSALTKNEEGENIVWLASPTENKKVKLQSKRVEISDQNETFFLPVNNDIGPYVLIINNPDKFIRREKEYALYTTQIIEPVLNPIDQARIDFDTYIFEARQAELHQIAEDCVNGIRRPQTGDTSLPDGTTGGGAACGATRDENDIMFEIFKSLTTPALQ